MPDYSYNLDGTGVVSKVRYEPYPQSEEIAPNICASVHDALWMLSQQWRVNEFKAEDAGTIFKAQVKTESATLNRFKGAKPNAPVVAFDTSIPLETRVERLPLIIDLGLSLEIGFQWYKILIKHGISGLYNVFVDEFDVDLPENDDRLDIQSNQESILTRKLTKRRIMDGARFMAHLRGGGHAKDIGTFSAGERASLDASEVTFYTWLNNTYSLPTSLSDSNWSEQQLEYQFSVSAPLSANQTQIVLEAKKYVSGNVDWYSVDYNPNSTMGTGGIQDPIPAAESSIQAYLTKSVQWKGMPKRRWWEFEDRNNDISKIITQKQDIAKLLLVEFAVSFSNDWFVVPHDLNVATINEIVGLSVTNVFDEKFLIKRAGQNAQWQQWDMFNISSVQTPGNFAANLDKLVMLPTIGNKVESEPVEKVLFLRDEVSNMVWGVEEVVPNDFFGGVKGKDAASSLEEFLDTKYPSSSSTGTTVPNYKNTQSTLRYRLQNEVPENWIPFVPSSQTGVEYNRLRKIQRGRLYRYKENGQAATPILPRTALLRQNLDNVDSNGNPVPGPYAIYQEEVSKSGFEVTTTFQRTRWYDGKPFVWLGRKVNTGRGESGIRFIFDALEPKEAEGQPTAPTAPVLPVLGASGWYMADMGVVTIGGFVDTWADLSGSGNHLSASSAALRPIFNGDGGANNYPYLEFDGSRGLFRSVFNQAASPDITVFAIFKSTDSNHVSNLVELSVNTNTNYNGFFLSQNNSGPDTMDVGSKGEVTYNLGSTEVALSAWVFFRGEVWRTRNSNEALPYINGGLPGVTMINGNNTFPLGSNNPLYVGSRANNQFFFKGHLSELIIYPKKLASSEISSVETYLATKYDLINGLPQIPMPDAGWWKPESGITTVSGTVSNWQDSSDAGNHFVSSSTAIQPVYVENGGPNNRPFLNFSGAHGLYIPSFNLQTQTQNLTVFCVCKSTSVSNTGIITELTINTNNFGHGMFLCLNEGGLTAIDVGSKGTSGYSLGRATISANTWMRLRGEIWRNRPSGEAMPVINNAVTGTSVLNANNSNNFFPGYPLFLGSRANSGIWLYGQVSELIIYGRDLSPTEIAMVEIYLKAKYKL